MRCDNSNKADIRHHLNDKKWDEGRIIHRSRPNRKKHLLAQDLANQQSKFVAELVNKIKRKEKQTSQEKCSITNALRKTMRK